MNSEHLLAQSAPEQSKRSSGFKRLQTFLQQRLVSTVVFSIALNLGLTVAATWNVSNASDNLKDTIADQNRLQEITSHLSYLDAALDENSFLRTGQPLWEKRYKNNTLDLQKITAAIKQDLPPSMETVLAQVELSSKQLADLEAQTFSLLKARKLLEASAIMQGKQYSQEKLLYTDSVQTIISSIKKQINNQIQGDRLTLDRSISLAIASLGLLVVTGSVIVVAVRGYIRDREEAQASLQEFQIDLLKLNDELQAEAKMRLLQQAQISEESNTLQTDVGHILDIVCSLEEGDLTVQAEVNERATGLVSDTLNRLTESLHRIVSTVVSSAYQVTNSASNLEDLAVKTAQQAQTQTRSIQEIKSLIDRVNSLTDNSYQQALATTEAVELAKVAVTNGQEEMIAMAGGIEILQEGTDQIVKRVQLLNDFVELAAQFSKDQKQVAALTKVLALNASLISNRAIKDRDPEQFSSLANEFKTIANQVNDLATNTNNSLVTLQQRTNQIQTVTSGLNQDVRDINQLVQKFTNEVNKSRQAFTNIQSVTDRVATMGTQVSSSSQDIVKVVNDTLTAIQSIDLIAQNTEDQATITKEQVQSMGSLAKTLLQMVEVFQLHPTTTAAGNISTHPTAELELVRG